MLQVWKRIIRNYFTFNKRERRGLYVLLLLLTTLALTHAFIRLSPPPDEPLSEEDKARLAELAAAVRPITKEEETKPGVERELSEIHWTGFDPNKATAAQLADLGLDSAIAHRLVNYRSKGGRFLDGEDVQRIYGMDSNWVREAAPYMMFPQRETKSQFNPDRFAVKDSMPEKPKRVIRVVELNTADSLDLIQIPGVGGFYASEIMEMRERMGGYRSHEQLLDIYNMRDYTFENLLKYTTVDTSLAQRININHCDLKRLGRHPYLTWKQARVIINYREQHGAFKSVKDILNTDVIADTTFEQLQPFLTTGTQ